MRKILFRGKRKDNVWVYGDLIHIDKGYIIITSTDLTIDNSLSENNALCYSEKEFSVVIPETIGQFTGLTDKNGKEIYEGDIMEYDNSSRYVVVYSTEGLDQNTNDFYIGAFMLKDSHGFHQLICSVTRPYKYANIIGNIHDNYELLNKE